MSDEVFCIKCKKLFPIKKLTKVVHKMDYKSGFYCEACYVIYIDGWNK